MLSIYPACFYKEDNGSYTVIFPDLNYLATQGDTMEEAMEMAIDCLAGYIYTCRKDGDVIPAPSPMDKIDAIAVAKEIDPDDQSSEAFVNMVSVDVELYAKENFEKSVKKTLSIPAWLNNAALEMNINFSQVLQEALLAKIRAK